MRRNLSTWIGIAIAVLAGIVAFGLLAQACGNKPIPGASARLKQFEADPVMKFRAPGTKLLDHSKESSVKLWNMEETETRIDQVFSMTKDPADTVEAYSRAAIAAGWTLTFEGCSRADQATGRAFSREINDQSSALSVRAELGTSPASTRHKPTLTVSIVAGGSNQVVSVGTRRKDLRCLTGLDPSSPELAQPKIDHVTPEALCAAVNLDGIRGVMERIPFSPIGDAYPSECDFDGGEHVGYLFQVMEASEPLAYYQDHSSVDAGPGQPFPFTDYEDGVWVMTAHGPLVIRARYSTSGDLGATSGDLGISPGRLLQIAGSLADL